MLRAVLREGGVGVTRGDPHWYLVMPNSSGIGVMPAGEGHANPRRPGNTATPTPTHTPESDIFVVKYILADSEVNW